VESKIVPGKLVAGVRDLSLVGEVVADALDLVESLLVACIARIEKRVRKTDPRMVGAEMKALKRAIDMRVQVQGAHQRLGAAAGDAKYDEIERLGHHCRCVKIMPEP
jgi:hypothetical protein